MSTRLENEVTRELGLTVDGRAVTMTLVPMDVANVEPERLLFGLKGLTAKHDKSVPIHLLLRAVTGWDVKLPPEIRPAAKVDENAEMKKLIEDLERTFGIKRKE